MKDVVPFFMNTCLQPSPRQPWQEREKMKDVVPFFMNTCLQPSPRQPWQERERTSKETITDHITELRKLYEALLKARGQDEGTSYMYFDLRDPLVKSLHKPVWGAWIVSREATDTMPSTFEGRVLALYKAQSTKPWTCTCLLPT